MRIRQVVLVFVVAVAPTLGITGPAAACKMCDQSLHCVNVSPGAQACIENGVSCALFFQCIAGKRLPELVDEPLTTWSLFDASVAAAPRALPAPASLRSEAGDIALGEEARATAGLGAPAGALADAALAFGDAFALSLVDVSGDGFAIQRSEEGGRVRLEVREVMDDVPGRLLASESLGPRDQLRVPVRVEGRDRELLLQAARVRGGDGSFEVARLRRALATAGRVLPARAEPLLRIHAQ